VPRRFRWWASAIVFLSVAGVLVAAPAGAADGDLVWARQVGSTGSDLGAGVAVDGSGNVYTAGYFNGTVDFDPGAGTLDLTSAGFDDGFVSKLDAHGGLVWARQLGGTSSDRGEGVAVDGSGNVYVTGQFYGIVDFDPGAGTSNLTSAGSDDGFVWKLDGVGVLVWARQLGGGGSDWGYGVAVGGSGNVYVTGRFYETVDFDPGAGTSNLISAGSADGFVWKLDAAGLLVWARQLGGTGDDRGFGVVVDGWGIVYATGYFSGTADFDTGAGTFELTAGATDGFVSKLEGGFVADTVGLVNPSQGLWYLRNGSGVVSSF